VTFPIVLSHFQTLDLVQAAKEGKARARISLDLNLSQREVQLTQNGARFPNGETLDWEQIEEINSSERGCFLIERGEAKKIQSFSEATGRVYSLMPTQGAPTMLLSGLPMHRFKDIDPHADTLCKIKTLAPVCGRALDTATGLGYTAIHLAKQAHVTTIEFDPPVLEIARRNPWSQELFGNPNIEQRIGDTFDLIQEYPAAEFSCILHDPPTFSLAGHLYSGAFYRQLYRVLKPGGACFHYIGDLRSTSGRQVSSGAARRLKKAGFASVAYRNEAFGLLCVKG